MFFIFRTSALSPMLNPDHEIFTPEIFTGKVMFLHLSVILSIRGRGCVADTSRRADIPWVDTPWVDTPHGQTPLVRHTPPRQTPHMIIRLVSLNMKCEH